MISCTAGSAGGGHGGGGVWTQRTLLGEIAVNSHAPGTLDYTPSTKMRLLQQGPAWRPIDGLHATINHSQE